MALARVSTEVYKINPSHWFGKTVSLTGLNFFDVPRHFTFSFKWGADALDTVNETYVTLGLYSNGYFYTESLSSITTSEHTLEFYTDKNIGQMYENSVLLGEVNFDNFIDIQITTKSLQKATLYSYSLQEL